MSNEAITWAWKQQVAPREKLILICLADAANDEDWQCWPSQRHIAAKTSYSIATVKRSLKELEEAGHINRTHRLRHDGTRTSDVYTLAVSRAQPDTTVQPDTTPVQPDTGEGYPVDRGTRSRLTYHEPSLEPSTEPKENLSCSPAPPSSERASPPDRFEEFWAAYPRKVGKQKARAKFTAACKRADPQAVIDGAHQLASDPNRVDQFTPHPTTWLERDGWGDEPLPPRAMTRSDENLARGYQIAQRLAQQPQQPSLDANPFEADMKEIRA